MQQLKIVWHRFKTAWNLMGYKITRFHTRKLTLPFLEKPKVACAYLYVRVQLLLVGLAFALLMLPTSAFAQTAGDTVGKFKEATDKITKAIQQISGIAIVLLLVGGFALLMWGGISENFRVKAVRIITFSIIGAACLFLFAQPLADFLTSTFGATGTA